MTRHIACWRPPASHKRSEWRGATRSSCCQWIESTRRSRTPAAARTPSGRQAAPAPGRAEIDRQRSVAGGAQKTGVAPHAMVAAPISMQEQQRDAASPGEVPAGDRIAIAERDRDLLRLVVEVGRASEVPG